MKMKILKITIKFDDNVDDVRLLDKIKKASKEEKVKSENIYYRVRRALKPQGDNNA